MTKQARSDAGKPAAKKHLGQHFLHDKAILTKIKAAVQPRPQEIILEIGPGHGSLTRLMCEMGQEVLSIEADKEAVAYLKNHCSHSNLTLWHGDVLKQRLDSKDYYIASNLPYNISSQVLFWMLEHRSSIRQAVVMLQKEVADRICAGEGSKAYGILSVLIGYYYERKLLFNVKPGAFTPPPKVQSAVIQMTRREEPMENVSFESLKQVTKTAFSQRRKTLSNALKPLGMPIPEHLARLRAEELSIAAFHQLTQQFELWKNS
jgi:16S rRNA (adenine1518-N6/adenine1519-N6)-dimethyltransferase